MDVAWRSGGGLPVAGHPPSVRMEEPESEAADPLRDRERIVPVASDVHWIARSPMRPLIARRPPSTVRPPGARSGQVDTVQVWLRSTGEAAPPNRPY